MAKLMSEGRRLEEIPVKKELTMKLSEYAEIYLPYIYLLKNGLWWYIRHLIEYLCSDDFIKDGEDRLKACKQKMNLKVNSPRTVIRNNFYIVFESYMCIR